MPKEEVYECEGKVKEALANTQFRVELTNAFNRLRVPQPTSTNALATPVLVKGTTTTQSGFGRIDTLTAGTGQRTAQALVRITF